MEYLRWSLGFTTFEWNARWPATWNGVALDNMESIDVAAPCFGARCGGRKNGKHRWHPSGTEMLPFRDMTVDGAGRWQRMCASCALLEGHLKTSSQFPVDLQAEIARKRSAATQRRLSRSEKEVAARSRQLALAAKRYGVPAPALALPAPPTPPRAPAPPRALGVAAPAPPAPLATASIADGALVRVSPGRATRKRPAAAATAAAVPSTALASPPTAAAAAAPLQVPGMPGVGALVASTTADSRMIPGRRGGLLGGPLLGGSRTIVQRPKGVPPAPPPAAFVALPDGTTKKANIPAVKQAIIAPAMKAFGAMLPAVKADGGLKGKGDETTAQVMTNLKQLQPNLPTMSLDRAEVRARSFRPDGGWEAEGSRAAKEKAMQAFHTEAVGLRGVCYIPEIYGRNELHQDERFHVCDADGEVIGVKCICPSCEKNTYVRPTTVSCGDDAKSESPPPPPPPHPTFPTSHTPHSPLTDRIAWGVDKCYGILYQQYVCCNPECGSVISKHANAPEKLARLKSMNESDELKKLCMSDTDVTIARDLGVSFASIDERLMNELLPAELRARNHVSLNHGSVGGWDEELATFVFRSHADVAEMEATLRKPRMATEATLIMRYKVWVAAEKRREESAVFVDESQRKP